MGRIKLIGPARPRTLSRLIVAAAAVLLPLAAWAGARPPPAPRPLFEDTFADDKLADGWSWMREERKAWDVTDGSLRLRPLRGSVWGGENTAQNLLLRAPPADVDSYAIEVTVSDASGGDPREPGLYEQAGLLWYADDDNYVKLVREWYDGRWMIVLAAEREGKARYAEAVAPAGAVRLRLAVKGEKVVGQFQDAGGGGEWKAGGEFELPGKPAKAAAKVGLTAHTPGTDAAAGRRAGFDDFVIRGND